MLRFRLISIMIGLLLPASLVFSQSGRPVTDFAHIQQIVDSNRIEMEYTIATTHYTFYLQPATPYSDQNINIAGDSAFIIIRDSVAAGYLPYFGGGYSIPQTGSKGVVFSSKIFDRTVRLKGKGKRQAITYSFAVVGLNDSYKINIDIQYDGSCYLYVLSTRRSPISYIGQIVEKIR